MLGPGATEQKLLKQDSSHDPAGGVAPGETQHCKSGADRQTDRERAGAGVLGHCAPLLRRSGKRRGEMGKRTPGVVSTPEHRQNAKYCQIAPAEARESGD